jgi:glycosyltransferase involved in cell wall biosynthesis
MRIAQVAPLVESVPPRLYGGTERIVSYLTEELVRLGHDVWLFASGDSRTTATLVAAWPSALRLTSDGHDHLTPHVLMLEHVVECAHTFDLIHFHTGIMHFPLVRTLRDVAHVTTLHGRLDLTAVQHAFSKFTDMPVVSISDAQRTPVRNARWVGTIPHGLPPRPLTFHATRGTYLAYLGRIAPEKRVDRAIAIATACGLPLRIAAKVDPVDRVYFERSIRHLLDHPLIEFVGEITDEQKSAFLGQARALLFPIDWPEPFGLVMIEALACGTPVIAFRRGSVPEVIEHGVTGFIVDDVEEAVEATRRVDTLDRAACRAAFERSFTVGRMASDYVQLYLRLLAGAERRRASSPRDDEGEHAVARPTP